MEGGRALELIDGKASLMPPSPIRRHQQVLAQLAFQVADYLDNKPFHAYFAPFAVRFPRADEPDEDVATVLQPDFMVFCDQDKLDEAGACGAPDWIVEVLLPASKERDLVVKPWV